MHISLVWVILFIFIWNPTYAACSTETLEPSAPSILSKPFDAKQDAINVNLLVVNKNLEQIAVLLASRTDQQRQQIKFEYEQNYKQSLEQDLAGKMKKTFERMMNALMEPLPEFMAREIDWSLSQSENWLYMSILCTSSGSLLKQITEAYYKVFNNKQLINELQEKLNDVDGRSFLVNAVNTTIGNNNQGMIASSRSDTNIVAEELIENQMTYIPDRYGYCTQQENRPLFDLLAKGSFAQIGAVVTAYQNKTLLSVINQIRTYCRGDLREAYSRIVRYAVDPVSYWVTEIYDSMAGRHTDDRALTLAILYRSEIDLATIREKFVVTYHSSLTEFIKDHCSGTYENIMVQIVTGN